MCKGASLAPSGARKAGVVGGLAAMGEAVRCDVFICHRGPDTKRGLVSHIKNRLQRSNLLIFVDYDMEKGGDSWEAITDKLRGARRVLIILSPNFEESPWCLKELCAATERSDACEVLLLVCYDRAPEDEDVALRAKLDMALSEYLKDFSEWPDLSEADIVERWRKGLKSAHRLLGAQVIDKL
ncbi:hypothetical protein WJX81_005029 [Elliptochloris bilobata]|uniref:ADP-ribosyl cyclase/cyclic ADP-ribose hydrolase n=1 Tax=Elliptochloris bilobata TaxID=381761 RepID=A0AAW1S8Y3_9CHLO